MNRRKFIANTALKALGTALPLSLSARRRPPINDTFVINAGIAGHNTRQLLQRLEKDCLSHQPELTILLAGTNDSLNSGNAVPPDEYAANMTELVKRIQDCGSQVLLMTLLPFHTPYLLTRHPAAFFGNGGPEKKRTATNAIIEHTAAMRQTALLDVGRLFRQIGNIGTDKSSLLRNEANSQVKDGVHPTADGYRVMALALYDHIRYHLLPTGRIVCFGDSITQGIGVTAEENYPAYLRRLLLD